MKPIDQFLTAYTESLTTARASNPEYAGLSGTVDDCVVKMVQAIQHSGRSDWFAYNPAMKQAGKQVGLKTSIELRKLFQVRNG